MEGKPATTRFNTRNWKPLRGKSGKFPPPSLYPVGKRPQFIDLD